MIPTPICDFVRDYAAGNPVRAHMPGHKGKGALEALDITEISGADDLFHPQGIIARSEEIASRLFGCPTWYSTEGSSLCIRAMLHLAMTRQRSSRPWVLAGRNAHKAFVNAAILLDFAITWLYPRAEDSFLSCTVSPEDVEAALAHADTMPFAVYLTSPDYLGSTADIAAIAAVCHRYGVPLVVDNAHGAYLRFLQPSQHPMDLGADLCCDSAHKTLPVLTGGAYLHISPALCAQLAPRVKDSMALFGSTSPSYLILQSLDGCNPKLEALPEQLETFLPQAKQLKDALMQHGFILVGEEPLKITITPKPFGYTGEALGELLEEHGIVCEFSDPDHLVLMLTPENTPEELRRIREALCAIPQKPAIPSHPLPLQRAQVVCSPRQAAFAPHEQLPVEQCLGRILASAAVSCPPAIPIAICGERLDETAIARFRYYGISHCCVVRHDI